jgi:MSHA biogenesis protein MshO
VDQEARDAGRAGLAQEGEEVVQVRVDVAVANWVVINNLTTVGTHFNAYNCPAAGTSHNCVRLTPGSSTPMTLAAAFSTTVAPLPTPPLASSTQRFFIVNTPVTYRCNTVAGTLDRHDGYPITVAQAANPAGAVRIANRVTACSFTYTPGSNTRSGLVTIALTVTDGVVATPEVVQLSHQVQVDNAP